MGTERIRRRPDCPDAPASGRERKWRRGWVGASPLPLPAAGRGTVVDPAGTRPSPSSPEVIRILDTGGKTYPLSQALAFQSQASSTHGTSPCESGLPSDLLGNHHQGFAHITGVLTAASFYKLGNGPEMGRNLPKVLERSKQRYQGSTTGLPESKAGPFPLHQVIRTKELTSSDDPLARFASTSLYSRPKILLAVHWSLKTSSTSPPPHCLPNTLAECCSCLHGHSPVIQ